MYNFKCEKAEYRHQGSKMWVHCTEIDDYCAFQRYCLTKRDVELTPMSQECRYNPKNKEKGNK